VTSTTRRTLAILTSTALASTLTLALPDLAEAATHTSFGGSVYGSTVKVGTLASSGKTSYVPMCTSKSDYTRAANAAGLNLPGIASVGAVQTRVRSSRTSTGISSTSTTSTGATSLLGSVVSAKAITTTARSHKSTKGVYSVSGSSVFVGLRVGGRSVTATPSKNTDITVPGIATVRLNAQSTSTKYGAHRQNVTALKVTLLSGNKLGLPVGTIVVGSASATLAPPVHHRAYGYGYGSRLTVGKGSTLSSGATSAVHIPCGGSNGVTLSNNTAAVNLASALRAGATKTTAKSTDTATSTVASTSATTAGANLLGGVVTMDAVTAKASTTRKGSALTRSTTGTSVVGLKVNGRSVRVSTAENTKVDILGVGTLTLRKAVRSTNGVTVYAAQLVLGSARGGLAAGTVLNVGVAQAGVVA